MQFISDKAEDHLDDTESEIGEHASRKPVGIKLMSDCDRGINFDHGLHHAGSEHYDQPDDRSQSHVW